MQVEAKTYMYRSYIALKKYNMVMQEITAQAPAVLRAVRVFAQFMQSPSPTSPALGEMEHMLSGMCVRGDGWVCGRVSAWVGVVVCLSVCVFMGVCLLTSYRRLLT